MTYLGEIGMNFKIFWIFLDLFQLQALSKKENKGGSAGSPDGVDSDGELETNLTPRTEAKYNKIDEEFQFMMNRNHGSRGLQAGFSSMPVSVPVNAAESQFGSDTSSQHDPGQHGGMPISPGHLSVSAGSPRPHSTGNG